MVPRSFRSYWPDKFSIFVRTCPGSYDGGKYAPTHGQETCSGACAMVREKAVTPIFPPHPPFPRYLWYGCCIMFSYGGPMDWFLVLWLGSIETACSIA